MNPSTRHINWKPVSKSFEVIFDLKGVQKRIGALEKQAADPHLWDDPDHAQEVTKELSDCKQTLERFGRQVEALEDAKVLLELAAEEEDSATAEEAAATLDKVEAALEQMEFTRMLSGDMDPMGALLSINAGAGGVDARDWAEMLQRMYLRWCQDRGFRTEILDYQAGEEAGISSVTILVEGDYAYGLLKAESGVHRLVRISPFDANSRRHTSFASVFVYPDLDDSIDVDIDEKDLRVDVYRASGAGGQHVNKTESAVRITHIPTGIVVQCQNERSQHKNRATAMRILRSRLYEVEREKQEEKMENLYAEKKAIDFGSQIRSYVLAPYQLVTDLRTDLKVGNVDAVLDGDLDPFINAFLMQQADRKNN
jgi:peptide chain release factor 2